MKRLLRIGGSIFSLSIFSILTWIVLGITISPDISNVFSLTYPIQFISLMSLSFFCKSSEISAKKENDKNASFTGIFFGIVFESLITIILVVFSNQYISFMGLDVSKYKTFAIYAILLEFIKFTLSCFMEKLYFENKEREANIYSLIFNVISFSSIVATSLLTKNQIIVIICGLVPSSLFIVYLFISQFKKFKISFNIKNNFRYESMDIVCYFVMFLTYFFSYSNAFKFGEKYLIALNFASLTADAQWDTFDAISTVNKIDLSTNSYNHKTATKNSIYFSLIIMFSSLFEFFAFFKIYNVNLKIGLLFAVTNYLDMLLSPIYYGFDTVIQLDYSPTGNTINHLLGYIIRFFIGTFVQNGFCVIIAQIISSLFMCIYSLYIRFRKYKVDKKGNLFKLQQAKI